MSAFATPILCASVDQITSCLSYQNINNFTTLRNNEDESSFYYKILNYSIQNLRFVEPTIPKPLAIILPESVEQLVSSVLCCREGLWEIRVRCGGHSYEGTSWVASDGIPFVIIDMMNLNKISVDLESELAWVEGGATLGETYYEIAKSSNIHGFSAGSCPTVGVGGHFSGGGFGLLSRKYGVAADNVVDALLVDANGRLLDRQGMGEDVFWAIRGGGGGVWGIVYAWKIQLLRVPRVVTGFIVSRPGNKSYVAKLVHEWQYVGPNLQDEFYLSCFVGAHLPEAKTVGISATFKGFYLGPRSEAVSILEQAFPELGIVEEDCKEMSWIDSILFFSGLGNGSSLSDLRNRLLQDKNYFKAKSDYVRNQISLTGIKAALDILEKEPKGYVILDPYGGIMHNISSDSIAFPHRFGNLFTSQYLVVWYEEDNEKSNGYTEWIKGLYNAMTPFVSWGPRAAYVNYVDFDLGVMEFISNGTTSVPSEDAVEIARQWGEKYFLKNYDRLVRAKTLIDPNNVFTNQQGIPPMAAVGYKSDL
ncbi:FAD_binding_4 domain-containing protein/BBE domain-containing protein [Cephalotus follicularis]|uniref:FAD_binding_4 domain-containing protein/BBE domain-containing protein n=1 Tax=Cephalotus follicularis TaxID=3775 RepID=A0A1Q3BVS4_CEPFO|nr:FAD_binding_4 domain-containing protein/BBE domain-containing protein [Cephalotus follicularis]